MLLAAFVPPCRSYAVSLVTVVAVAIVVVGGNCGGFSSRSRILGECPTIHSPPPAPFFKSGYQDEHSNSTS